MFICCRRFLSSASRPTTAFQVRRLVVDDEHHATSLEQFVATKFSLRRSFARLKILNAEVSVAPSSAHGRRLALANGKLKPAVVVHAGDVVEVLLPPSNPTAAKSAKSVVQRTNLESKHVDINLKSLVIYKDQHIIVINKPRAVPVQAGSKMSTSIAELLNDLQFSNKDAPRLVHRLDKDTTGCLVLARTKESAIKLSNLFGNEESGFLVKKYQAITCGSPAQVSGRITTGIVQTGTAPTEKLSVIEWHETDDLPENNNAAKKATTEYSVQVKQKHVSLVELTPTTGRKHQLRLHCAQVLETPILGDYKYGPGCPKQLRSAFGNIKTVPMHLHLQEISIKDCFEEIKEATMLANVISLLLLQLVSAQSGSFCVDADSTFCVSVAPSTNSPPGSLLVTIQTVYSGWVGVSFGATDMSANSTGYVGWANTKGEAVISQRTIKPHALPSFVSSIVAANSSSAAIISPKAKLAYSFLAPVTSSTQASNISCIWAASNKSPANPDSDDSAFDQHDKFGSFVLQLTPTPTTSVAVGNATTVAPLPVSRIYCYDSSSTFCATVTRDPAAGVVSFDVYSSAIGYAGIGTGGSMAGSSMFISWLSKNGTTVISQRDGLGHTLPQISKNLIFTQISPKSPKPASTAAIQFSFTVPISRNFVSTNRPTSFIFATSDAPPENPSNPGSAFSQHTKYSSFSLDFSSASSGNSTSGQDHEDGYTKLVLLHAVFMFVAWGVLVPLSIWIARYMKLKWSVGWYRIHVLIMTIGVGCLTIAGLVAVELNIDSSEQRFITSNHGIIGTAIALAIYPLQVILGFVCNRLFKANRIKVSILDQVHWWIGRIVVVLAIVNMYLGLVKYGAGLWVIGAYWAWILLVIVVAFALVGEGFLGGATTHEVDLTLPKVVPPKRLSFNQSTVSNNSTARNVRFQTGNEPLKRDLSRHQQKSGNQQSSPSPSEVSYDEMMANGKPKLKIRNMSRFGEGLLFKSKSIDELFERANASPQEEVVQVVEQQPKPKKSGFLSDFYF
ncbi:UNVERIFIED_CONTAM: hypothetical protein HDU68_008193 [Siphonaria sp. JEL0065]|nr:hypothetical protein HDU68_008193 [Siphonaria sp. JEL0065]